MKLFENKDAFYGRLWEDYQQCKRKEEDESEGDGTADKKSYIRKSMEQCFIYSYQKDKKIRIARRLVENDNEFREYQKRERSDKFVLLCAAHTLWESGKLDLNEYGEIFRASAKRENGGKHFLKLFESDPKLAYEDLSYHLLCGSIQDMFGNKGYKQPRYDRDGNPIREPVRKPADDSKSIYADEIEMLYSYSRYISSEDVYLDNKAPASVSERREKGAELFSFLRTVKCGEVFIPLYIDPYSAAGVYIIGDHRVDKPDSDDSHVYTIHFDEVYYDEGYSCDEEADGIAMFELTYHAECFDSVEEAFDRFEELSAASSEDRYYSGYTSYNSGLPITLMEKAVGESFSRYVETEANLDYRKRLEAAQREQGLREERENRKKYENAKRH